MRWIDIIGVVLAALAATSSLVAWSYKHQEASEEIDREWHTTQF